MKFRYKINIPCIVLIKVTKNDFESQSFNTFLANKELQNDELNPNVNYYQAQISSLDTK